MTLYIDIETYSRVDLRKANAYSYATDDQFQILMAAWAVDDGPVRVALNPREINDIPGLFDPEVEKVAHNAAFERICFSEYQRGLYELEQGEYLDPAQWTCTMALAAEWGYPRSLGKLAQALGAEEKDEAGTRLINLFCKPNRKGERTLPRDKPADWEAFVNYCIQDVATLRDVHQRLGGWPTETERQVYLADQAINDRGILVDAELARCAVAAAEQNKAEQTREIIELTGIENPGSNPQMLGWFNSQHIDMPNLQAETVKDWLKAEVPDNVRRVLELRQELALVAAKKYTAALDRVNEDGRLRGSFQFFGAHTGRWAGRGVQLQNLPSATMETELDTELAILDLKLGLGASAHDLKALVRAMFTGPFTVVDYSAIEARVVSWLAGEEWALQAFRDGRDIYVETGQRMGGMSRKEGKVAVLALGYNGGINSLRVMGAEGSDEHLQILVNQWRRANPAIVGLWAEMQDSFRNGGPVGAFMHIEKDGADRLIRLPSGRAVVYHNLRARWVEKWGKRVQVISFADANGGRTDTYGGRLVENVTQAVARDILAEALVRLQAAGKDVVGHVHDEVIVQGGTVEEVSSIMTESPAWADGLPIAAAGFQCERYRKD